MQKDRVFELDDKSIININSKDSNLQNVFIISNFSNSKQKQDLTNSVRSFNNAIFLAKALEKLIDTLAKALVINQNLNIISVISLALYFILSSNNDFENLNWYMTKVETRLEDI